MPLHRLAAPALLGTFAFVSFAAFGQTAAAPTHDPRIAAIIHSLEKVRTLGETELSPDGNLIAWEVSGDGIQVASLDNPSHPHPVTACAAGAKGEESGLAWLPDSKHLAFFSDCTENGKAGDKKTAIFVADADSTAAPHLLAPLNGFAESLEYSPDGKFLSFLYVEGATRPSGALAAMKPPSGVIGVEGLEVQRVAAVDASGGNLTQITPANLHVYEFSWSSDGKNLAFIAAPPPGENNWWVAKLYTKRVGRLYQAASSSQPEEALITESPKVAFDPNTTPGPLHGLQLAVPRWSPDGSEIAFIGGLMSDQGVTGGDIYVIPAAGGEAKNVTPDRASSPAWIEWVDNQQLGVAETKDAQSHLFVYNIETGQESSEYNATLPATVGAGGLQMRISTAGNEIAYIQSSFEHAPEVWAGPLGDLKQITHYNDALKPSWGKSESVDWSNDGFHVQGWLLYPADYDPAKKYPMIVLIHGGPSSVTLPRWPSTGFGGVPFSALGYFVLLPNPRGSYGEGEKFTAANRKDFGYGDLRDILAGVDAVTRKYPVDPQRVGVAGWSYGGFMSMFAVSQTHRFRAAVGGAGVSDWLSYYGENSIDQWMLPFFGASVYDDPAVYAKSSPINYVKQVKTPTLLVVGDRDGEGPAPQSFEFWHALRDENVPTQLVVYPNEGHRFVDPAHQIDVLERALGWFDEYMK
ncbi:dipeptidyl aminopeptidase/acylaminoacyl peptidase [Silvibacterium bohemicum]|uniref:Dipeptidyl aminopeptidase/acylaminoacyl peptidase n=1 Tax=Silvibacterium bohemicum TaxID=1577686 RepID=A0A841KAN6_9BACT|nr:S9 family peptidase [Silvibacterium bohemicum]MBB6147374.1 dipeptidyl aminopeptidase/acylaminoacyl peptidase [Silvibacterium bohemicum]